MVRGWVTCVLSPGVCVWTGAEAAEVLGMETGS